MRNPVRVDVAEVRLWEHTVGAVLWRNGAASFEYDPAFLRTGWSIAPLHLPLRSGTFVFPELNRQTYQGLPGLLADALPDRFGNALINQWLTRAGYAPDSLNPIERLCYIHDRGMGALTFHPVVPKGRLPDSDLPLTLASLVNAARATLQGNLDQTPAQALTDLLSVGISAGGARAKAVIAWHPETGDIRSGQYDAPDGFEHWLLKFDGVGQDLDLGSSNGYGRIEYAYHLMARAAGIVMSDSRLLEENGRAHFMTRRFDRSGNDRLHMQSLCAMNHLDFNLPGAHGYEQWFQTIEQVVGREDALEQAFRHMVFNVLARNHDDHTKNFAFLMDRNGDWQMAPSYDLTFAYRPGGQWTATHQMSIQGKQDHFDLDDLLQAGTGYLKRDTAEALYAEVAYAVAKWPEFAAMAGVPEADAQRIKAAHRDLKDETRLRIGHKGPG